MTGNPRSLFEPDIVPRVAATRHTDGSESRDGSRARSCDQIRLKLARLRAFAEQSQLRLKALENEISDPQQSLAVGERVTEVLEELSRQLFAEQLGIIERKLTLALQEVLEQPIELKAEAKWRNRAAAVDFRIVRNGNTEDLLKGQGGSVANTVSVGLRMLALMNLDERKHRRFLVLDEQDCWLAPDLVPKLVRIVHEAGKALGFQVIMISHHDAALFQPYADKIYRFRSGPDGVVQVAEQ